MNRLLLFLILCIASTHLAFGQYDTYNLQWGGGVDWFVVNSYNGGLSPEKYITLHLGSNQMKVAQWKITATVRNVTSKYNNGVEKDSDFPVGKLSIMCNAASGPSLGKIKDMNFWRNLEIGFLIRLLISLAVFSVIIFMVVPKIAKWFFKRADSEKYSNFIFVLFIVFASGFLVELGGIEPIIGAFAAGLALNRLIPHSSALMNRIEFFGNALFIPIFLISVGMLVDMSIVFDGLWTMIVAVTLTIVALAGKWVAAYATQKSFQYSSVQRNIIFGDICRI
jgi:hypothetical protein